MIKLLFSIFASFCLVTGMPEFEKIYEDVTVEAGSNAAILCHAEGDPTPAYTWYTPEGEQIDESSDTIYAKTSDRGSTLFIINVAHAHEGLYICVAANSHGFSTKIFKVIVEVSTLAGIPEFEKKYEDVTVEVGSNAAILCHAEGDPTPAYTWYTPKGKVINETGDSIYAKTSDRGATLFIINVAHAHEGLYTCGAANSHGLSTKIFKVIVEVSTRNVTEIDEIKVIQVREDSVLFEIVLVGSTTAQWDIQVRYNETYDKEYNYVTLKKGERLEVKDLVTGGKYDFSFLVGKDSPWSDRIEVTLFPAVPQVIFRSFTGGKLMIQMYRMMGDRSTTTIDKYRVSYNPIKIEKGNLWIPDGDVISKEAFIDNFYRVEITGLSQNTYYEIRVEAHTDAGYGKPYRHIIFTASEFCCPNKNHLKFVYL